MSDYSRDLNRYSERLDSSDPGSVEIDSNSAEYKLVWWGGNSTMVHVYHHHREVDAFSISSLDRLPKNQRPMKVREVMLEKFRSGEYP